MSLKIPSLSFRLKIILTVVLLATLPVILLGLNSMRIASRFQEAAQRTQNRLLLSLGGQMENYFIRLNESLGFVQSLERLGDDSRLGSIIFNALQSNREMDSAGYVRDNRFIVFFGEDSGGPPVDARLTNLLRKFEKDKTLHISEAFTGNGTMYFDMIYPLRRRENDALFFTFSLESLQRKMAANRIGESGEFAVIDGSGNLFAGPETLDRRMDFIGIESLLKENPGVIQENIRGYRLLGKKLEVTWPLWIIFTQRSREAEALTGQLRAGMFIFLALILISAGSLSYILARDFSRPISSLLEAVKRNYGGEVDVKASLSSRDRGELAILINGFNRMIDSLGEARQKLVEKEKMAAVGEMANIVGHDIKNPLGTIKNGVYFFRYTLKESGERVKKTLDIMDREIVTINDIVENLLGYSRQRPPALSSVDVNSLLDEVISIIEPPENVKIEKEYAENLPAYQLDRVEMKQVFVNLINNAVQACDKEEGRVRVISSNQEDQALKVRVIDNGVGIPKDKLDSIFKAFYSTKSGGTGLGMSSVKNIIERHGGTISVSSEPGKGTEMTVVIPPLEKKGRS